MEEFKEVIHNGAKFKVDRNGNVYVWKISLNDWEKAKYRYNADGYLVVGGYNPVKKRSVYAGVHILVAKAFIPNPNNLPEVNHKDFNRKNPCADNLEWVTHQENIEYSRKANRYPSQVGELNPNYGNRKLSKKYAENKKLSKEKQSRPMGQNGRAKKCIVLRNKEIIGEFSCQREAFYFLIENKCLSNKVKYPEGIISKLKREEGYNGYKLIFR